MAEEMDRTLYFIGIIVFSAIIIIGIFLIIALIKWIL